VVRASEAITEADPNDRPEGRVTYWIADDGSHGKIIAPDGTETLLPHDSLLLLFYRRARAQAFSEVFDELEALKTKVSQAASAAEWPFDFQHPKWFQPCGLCRFFGAECQNQDLRGYVGAMWDPHVQAEARFCRRWAARPAEPTAV
jgi:hypothetical protein